MIPFIAIERQIKMSWSQFVTFVTETEAIVAPDQTDTKAELLRRYASFYPLARARRRYPRCAKPPFASPRLARNGMASLST